MVFYAFRWNSFSAKTLSWCGGKNKRVKKKEKNLIPGLAVLLVGENPASRIYVENKKKACEDVGIRSWIYELDQNVSMKVLKKQIQQLNSSSSVHGILVQLPLPDHLKVREILNEVDPRKDVDALTSKNLGLLCSGQNQIAPCTPSGIMKLLDHYDICVLGQKVVVVGRSLLVGLPVSLLLQQAGATVTLCHSQTKDLRFHTRQADIVVVAVGKKHLLGSGDFNQTAVVVDVGIHSTPQGLCGDVRFEEVKNKVRAITPVPGGVGPMTVAMLLENTYLLAATQ